MSELMLFDIPLEEPKIVEKKAVEVPTPVTSEDESANEFDFNCTLPQQPDTASILAINDKVVITPAKYGHPDNVPGIVKTFLPATGEIVVRRKDGEGAYHRYELCKI